MLLNEQFSLIEENVLSNIKNGINYDTSMGNLLEEIAKISVRSTILTIQEYEKTKAEK